MRKKGEIVREHTIHLEIFCFEHSSSFFFQSPTVLLSYGYGFVANERISSKLNFLYLILGTIHIYSICKDVRSQGGIY